MNIVTPWAPDGAKIIKSRLKKGWNLGMRSQSPSLNHFFGKLGCFNIYCFMESFKTTLMLSVLLDWAWETESTSDQCPPLCLRAPIIACVRFQGHNTYSQHSDSGGQWNTQISLWNWNSSLSSLTATPPSSHIHTFVVAWKWGLLPPSLFPANADEYF